MIKKVSIELSDEIDAYAKQILSSGTFRVVHCDYSAYHGKNVDELVGEFRQKIEHQLRDSDKINQHAILVIEKI